jgi:methylmalonyl-CoA mutase C-terminal domain/subunit
MPGIRVLIAKPGLDGHDRGAKIVARALREAGMEVVYLGLRNTPVQIAAAAVQEDVAVVGLSVLSGSHLPLARKVLAALADAGAGDIPVVLGGTIPPSDVGALTEMGIAGVLATSAPLDDAVALIRRLANEAEGIGAPS